MAPRGNNEERMTNDNGAASIPIFLWLFVICSWLFVAAPQAQQVFRAGVDLTTFGVTVTDRKGNLVTDLGKEDFEILEDGKPQTLQQFARGEGDASPEMHLGLMLDASGSMQS
ncbi:MAG: hypothetical protein ACRD1W_12290, partial [Vicinamibacterales bacterium]